MQTVMLTQWQFWLLLSAVYLAPNISARSRDKAGLVFLALAAASLLWRAFS